MAWLKPRVALTLLAVAAALLLALDLTTGPLAPPLADLLTVRTPDARLALELRLPRLLTALLAGAALAAAGAALQTLFRNPLVAPDVLGVSSGAALGAVAALLLGLSPILVQLLAFGGGLLTLAAALACARAARTAEPQLALVLCGLVAGALAAAGIALALTLADPYTQLPQLTFWLLGSFSRAALPDLALAAPPALVGLIGLWWLGFRLDALGLGDDQARALGLPAARLRRIALVCTGLAVAPVVALAGMVGWLGLLAPHIARLLVGSEAARLLPAAAFTGATLALALDLIGHRLAVAELPVGMLAALLGAPAFLVLFIRAARPR